MEQIRDKNSGALIFKRTVAEDKIKKQNKLTSVLEKDVISLTKKISTLQTKHRELEKRMKKMENKE